MNKDFIYFDKYNVPTSGSFIILYIFGAKSEMKNYSLYRYYKSSDNDNYSTSEPIYYTHVAE